MLTGNSFVVRGTAGTIEPLIDYLEQTGIPVRGSSDAYVRTYASFGVEEARELRERAALSAHEERRVFIISAPSMTNEAQNALLKTLEEPPAGALFFLIVSAPATLLPTLRSRVQTLVIENEGDSPIDIKQFLAAGLDVRIKMLAPILEKGEDDKRDMGSVLMFLSSLEHSLEKRPEALSAVYRARKFLGDKGALVKPLLEQVALLTPRV